MCYFMYQREEFFFIKESQTYFFSGKWPVLVCMGDEVVLVNTSEYSPLSQGGVCEHKVRLAV